MKKILLHVCCAPCAIYVVKKLQQDNYEVSLFFYNPNIQPEEEYLRRKAEVERWAEKENLDLIISPYKTEEWLKRVSGLEYEPEGGSRCRVCFDMRLADAARYASLNDYEYYASTLTISPHKNSEIINRLGKEIAAKVNGEIEQGLNHGRKIEFLEADWKKQDGFKKACEMSHAEGFYRQDYCGCLYSKRNKIL